MATSALKRRICIVTGSRADYGLLKTLMRLVHDDPSLELSIVVTGMHLAPEFGLTINHITKDGFTIDAKVESLLSGDTYSSVTRSTGIGLIGFADCLPRLNPDVVVLLGDRYEILAAAIAAMLHRIPIAHIHGGEVTEGAVDESIRHSVTKMSHLHFTSTEVHRQRVIQMGEQPELVHFVGAPGLDLAASAPRVSREILSARFDFKFREQNLLLTYHPETLGSIDPVTALNEVTCALDRFPHLGVIITMPNADASGRAISKYLHRYVAANCERMVLIDCMGDFYFSTIREVDLVIGNSSSGLIEVPFFEKPTVNIGDRQKGRLKAASVIDSPCNTLEISDAIKKALQLAESKNRYLYESPYGTGGASQKIKSILSSHDLTRLKRKLFYDLPAIQGKYNET